MKCLKLTSSSYMTFKYSEKPTNNFVIQCTIKMSQSDLNSSKKQVIHSSTENGGYAVFVGSGKLGFYWRSGSTYTTPYCTMTNFIPDKFNEILVAVINNIYYVYCNGIFEYTTTLSSLYALGPSYFGIGADIVTVGTSVENINTFRGCYIVANAMFNNVTDIDNFMTNIYKKTYKYNENTSNLLGLVKFNLNVDPYYTYYGFSEPYFVGGEDYIYDPDIYKYIMLKDNKYYDMNNNSNLVILDSISYDTVNNDDLNNLIPKLIDGCNICKLE